MADLLACLHGIEDIDREGILDENDKGMAGSDPVGIFHCHLFQGFIISLSADQAMARGLAEADSEFCIGNRTNDDLKKVFDGLDEVALAEDDIAALRNLYTLSLQFHQLPPSLKGFKDSRLQEFKCISLGRLNP
jgi:hypothetical protein